MFRLFDHIARDRRVIVDRLSIRHRTNTRPTARDRRGATRRNRFLMLLSRLAQMNVQINKSRRNQQTRSIKNSASSGADSSGFNQAETFPSSIKTFIPVFSCPMGQSNDRWQLKVSYKFRKMAYPIKKVLNSIGIYNCNSSCKFNLCNIKNFII